jgi:hypothetical protein
VSQDAKESIFAWLSVIVFIAMFALTLKLLDGTDEQYRGWPFLTGLASIVALAHVAKHLNSRRNRKEDG